MITFSRDIPSKGRFTRYDLSARFISTTASERKFCVYFDSRWTTDSWKWKSVRSLFLKSGRHSERNRHVNQRVCECVIRINTLKIKEFKMADTKRTTGRSLEEKLQVLHNSHGTIYRPVQTGRQIVPCKPALGRSRDIFLTLIFFCNFTIERWWVSDVRNVKKKKKMGGHRLRFGENLPGKTP